MKKIIIIPILIICFQSFAQRNEATGTIKRDSLIAAGAAGVGYKLAAFDANGRLIRLKSRDTTVLLPADTVNRWVQNVYARNDSLFKLKNAIETFVGKVNGAGAISTATNGLTASAGNVKLGGTLVDAVTNVDANGNGFRVTNVGSSLFKSGLYMTNAGWELQSLNGSYVTNILSNQDSTYGYVLTQAARPGSFSSLFVSTDSININPPLGNLKIDTLTKVPGIYAMRYNPATGLVSYADTTIGGGGGGGSTSLGDTTIFLSTALGSFTQADLSDGSIIFGDDKTSAIQTILNIATSTQPLKIIWDVKASVTGLIIGPNTTIEALQAQGAILRNNSNKPLFVNRDTAFGREPIDSNITIDGGFWNGNSYNAALNPAQTKGTVANGLTNIFSFYGVRNLTVRNFNIIRQTVYSIHGINIRNGLYENGVINSGVGAINSDGVHFDGYSEHCTARNLKIKSKDDAVAVSADDLYLSTLYAGGVALGYYPATAAGPISDIEISDIFLDEGLYGVRILSGASRVDNIRVKNITGSTAGYAVVIDNYRQSPSEVTQSGGGNIGVVTVENVDVAITAHGSVNTSLINVNCNIDKLILKDLKRNYFYTTGVPTLFVTGASTNVKSIIIDGYDSRDTSTFTTSHIFNSSTIGEISILRANIIRTKGSNNSALIENFTGGTINSVKLIGVIADSINYVFYNSATVGNITATNVRYKGAAQAFATSTTIANLVLSTYLGGTITSGTFTSKAGDAFIGPGITAGTTLITSGTDTRVPFNDGGVYNEDAGLTYNKTTDVFTVGGRIIQNAPTGTAGFLKVNGSNLASSTNINPGIDIYNDGVNLYGFNLGYTAATSRYNNQVFFPTSGDYVISTHTGGTYPTLQSDLTSRLIVRGNSGNVGIGTTTPDSLLTVEQGIWGKRGVRFSGLPTGVGTKAVRIDASGNLSVADTTTAGGGGDMILASVQSVTGLKTFDKDKFAMKGTGAGVTTLSTANTSGTSYTATLQAATGTIAYLSDITGSAISSLTAATGTNNINNGDNEQLWRWDGLTAGRGLYLTSNSTAAVANQTFFQVYLNGTNATSSIGSYAAKISNEHGGTGADNTALFLSASGGSINTALYVNAGDVYLGGGTVSAATGRLNIDGNGYLSLGNTGGTTGKLKFLGATSGTVTVQSAAVAGTYTLTLPTTDGNANEFLQTDGNGVLTWAAAAGGGGTVTSITLTQPASGITITGSGTPITSTGTPTFALANDLLALEGLASTGIAVRTATDTWAQRTITAGEGITMTNGNGVSGNPTVAIKGWDVWSNATVNTTSATITTLATITCPSDSRGVLKVTMVATETSAATSGLTGTKYIHWKSSAGTVTVLQIVDEEADYRETWTTAVWTVDASGTDLRIRVTANNTNSTDWNAQYQLKYNTYVL